MRRAVQFLAELLMAVVLLGIVPGDIRAQSVLPDTSERWSGVTYEIFVQSFADGNGDGIGDFEGLTAKLDMIDRLGAEAIWLMPIHPSPSYHKYDVTNYRAIHPDYGTMADFERFLDAAHDRGIEVIMDLVINHTSRKHPWFQRARKNPDGPYRDLYVWADPDTLAGETVDETGPDTDNQQRWHEAKGTDERYYGYFWGGMPDLNYQNPAVRDSVIAIGRFWLNKGVDGFRLDAARHIHEHLEPEIGEAEAARMNHHWWETFRAKMEAVNEDVFLVGEVWDKPKAVTPYLSGLHSVFNFEIAGAMVEAVRTGNADSLAHRHARIRSAYRKAAPNFVDVTFLTNHDQNRVRSVLGTDAKARTAAHLLFTLPGAPFVYYGEEIGMRGRKPDPHIREPYLWTRPPDSLRATWIEPKYSTDETVTPSVVQQRRQESMWRLYQRLIELRSTHPALRNGILRPVDAAPSSVSLFVRAYPDASLLVAHNVSSRSTQLLLPDSLRTYDEILYRSGDAAKRERKSLRLPAHSTILLRK